MFRRLSTLSLALSLALASASNAAERTATFLLLHTNDIHAHLRADDSGKGGLPYVSTYVKNVRQNRHDVLLVDAGDVLEKGNMISWLTHGRVMYQAMNQIGYNAGVPGNHDFAFGPKYLRANLETAKFPILCANPPSSEVPFEPSAIINVNDVRVGVIGMTLFPSSQMEQNKTILSREAKRLEKETDLLIALCHLNSKTCLALADAVPEIGVFVSGHAHEVLSQPIVAKKSGALVVQAGSLARYVGRWELTVDLDAKKVASFRGELVSLTRDTSPCDEEMVAWIKQQEQEVCPEAGRIVGKADHVIRDTELAKLFAQSLLQATRGEIVLSHTSMLRGQIYPGPIEIDDLFVTYVPGKQREPVEVQLTGQQLKNILAAAEQNKGEMVMVSRPTKLNIQESKTYRVVLMRGNWVALQEVASLGLRQVQAKTLDVDLIKSLANYMATADAETN